MERSDRVRVMLDTNVIASGLFFEGLERRILVQAIQKEFDLIISDKVIEETRKVIARKFGNHPLKENALRVLELILSQSQIIEEKQCRGFLEKAGKHLRHVKDVPVLAAALAATPDFFVTGDKDFLEVKQCGVTVTLPKEFAKMG